MAIVATLNTTFGTLNGKQNLFVKQNTPSRERSAVVNIAIGASDNYATGGITVDFSKVSKFKKVYFCDIIHQDIGVVCSFVPAALNDAATGKIKMWTALNTEVTNGNTGINSKSLTVVIRGY